MLLSFLKRLWSTPFPSRPNVGDGASLLHQADAALGRQDQTGAQRLADLLTNHPGYEADARHICAAIALQRGDTDDALAFVELALQLKPDSPQILNTKGQILHALGRFDEAISAYSRAITLDPDAAPFFLNYCQSKKFSPGDVGWLEAKEARAFSAKRDARSQIEFHYAFGKAFDDCALYDCAFDHFKAANMAKFQLQPFDVRPLETYINEIKETFTPDFLARHREDSIERDSREPIFIVGMPRCGSTLLESLLAKQAPVTAGGELTAMNAVVKHLSAGSFPYPASLRQSGKLAVRELVDIYYDEASPIIGSAHHFTDKHPYNFYNVGLIAALFPKAKIVHIHRNPLDACLSCYFTAFSQAHEFTNDIETLCRYYGLYETMLTHWRAVVPDLLIDVKYEHLVTEEGQTMDTLLHRLGFPTSRHNNASAPRKTIHTASAWQARQPLYTSSLKRRHNYRNHIAPFVDALTKAGVKLDNEN